MAPQSHFDPSLTKISSSATLESAIPVIRFGDRPAQPVVALLGSVAAKGLPPSHVIHRLVERCRLRPAAGFRDVADAAPDEAGRRRDSASRTPSPSGQSLETDTPPSV